MHAITTIRGIEARERGTGYLVARSTADIRDIMFAPSSIPELPPELRQQKCLHADFIELPGRSASRAQSIEEFKSEVTNLIFQNGPVRLASIGGDEDRLMIVVLEHQRYV